MKNYFYLIVLVVGIIFTACEDKFLNLGVPDALTESSYYKNADHFRAASNDFYNGLWGWKDAQGLLLDRGSDLTLSSVNFADYGRGNITVPNSDNIWTQSYKRIRGTNILLEKANDYSGDSDEIAKYVAVAKFFRAYHHFFLLQRFGGIPVVTKVLDTDELNMPRNSRYEVFYQIKQDLADAIPDLQKEFTISSEDKGQISREAAQSLLAKAFLYEATWEKYVGDKTDGDGATSGAGSQKPEGYPSIDQMLEEAVNLSKEVMDNGGFELWNYNKELGNLSMYYLFNLEDADSNPAGLDKSTNKEFIFYSKYDYVLRKGNTNISHASGYSSINQNFMDMFLCEDGLPIDKSPLFVSYQNNYQQLLNRDYRLFAYAGRNEQKLVIPEIMLPFVDGGFGSGEGGNTWYWNRKFRSYNYPYYREANHESADFPHIRLAEVYLIYAEALYELNGDITDKQLNESLNLVRGRSGVAPLTNDFASLYDLNILEEIRRERAVELFQENSRFNDLKRWGIAEERLNATIFGPIIEGTDYENNPDFYKPETYAFGEAIKEYTGAGSRRAIVQDPAVNRNFTLKNYLYPIPSDEIILNNMLLQNPGY